MLHVHLSNRIERLADDLVEVVRPPLDNPFANDCIVVQSLGMQRWLEMTLATATGVWANGWFPFPEAFARKLRRDLLEEPNADRTFDRAGLTFAIAAAVAGDREAPAFAPLRRYLGTEIPASTASGAPPSDPSSAASSRLVALAQRIADVFDGYQLHRPDLLLAWEANDRPVDGVLDDGVEDPDDTWQPHLWRTIAADHAERSRGARQTERLIAALEGGRKPDDPDFARVSVFGLSALSPLYVRLLAALARHVDVHVFALAASTAGAKALQAHGAVGRMPDGRAPALEAMRSVPPAGHPLLRSLGGVAREFQLLACTVADAVTFDDVPNAVDDHPDRTEDVTAVTGAPDARAVAGIGTDASPTTIDTGERSALRSLQSDLDADAPTARPHVLERLVRGDDASVSIHACHGPLREVEVLRDQLVAAFDDDPTLAPHDICVLMPDVEGYAPYVEAVFGATRLDGCRLPFAIADRPGRDLAVVQAFGQLLHVLRGRFTAAEVVDLLALPPVRARFGVEAGDLQPIRDWVAATGIRWAADADHRRAVGQPAENANTWRFGLDRLLLGFAVGEDDDDAGAMAVPPDTGGGVSDGTAGGCFRGVLPAPDALGAPRPLGALSAFTAHLDAARSACIAPRPAQAWAAALTALLASTVAQDGANAWQHGRLRTALDDLAARAAATGYDGDLPLDCVTDLVLQAVDADDRVRGFLGGGITFCALAPMRSIPFRVVALLGMNDGAFPRSGRPFAFDLVARHPRLGDRRARDDDRFLFLEALLAARDRFVVTFSGQSMKDNSRVPPSVVVSELLDALVAFDPAAAAADTGATADDLVTWHPLQPFSPRYFAPSGTAPSASNASTDRRLFTYAGAYAAVAAQLQGERTAPPPFLPDRLAPEEAGGTAAIHGRRPQPSTAGAIPSSTVERGSPADVALDDLTDFFRHPARHLLRRRLGLAFPGDEAPLDDREPLALDGLGRYAAGEAVVRDLLAGRTSAAAEARVRAAGIAPIGTPGTVALAPIVAQAGAIAAATAPWLARPARPPIDFGLQLPDDGASLTGTLTGVREGGLVRCGFARVDVARSLDLWIEHLVLCALELAGRGSAPVSGRVGRPPSGKDDGGAAAILFAPVDAPARVLATLVGLYRDGQTRWLPFLPRASHAFAAAADDDPAHPFAALRAARVAFDPPAFARGQRGEGEDDWIRLIVGDAELFADDGDPQWQADFAVIAHQVYDPLLAARMDAEPDR